MKLIEAVGIRLDNLMKEKGFSQYDFYTKGGIPKATVSQALNGTRERLAVRTVYEIISTMGISLKEFFDDPVFDDISD